MSAFDVSNLNRPTIRKDPQADLDYGWDFTNLVDPADPIVSAQFTVVGTVVVDSGSVVIQNGKIVYAFVSGGTLNEVAQVTCRYTTAAGRQDERSLFFRVRDR